MLGTSSRTGQGAGVTPRWLPCVFLGMLSDASAFSAAGAAHSSPLKCKDRRPDKSDRRFVSQAVDQHIEALAARMTEGAICADFSLRTLWNETAYDIAKYRGYASICRLFEEGKFDTTELYVDRKWFKFDLHKVRHGAVHAVKVEDSHFYIKTQFINRPFDKHENLHH